MPDGSEIKATASGDLIISRHAGVKMTNIVRDCYFAARFQRARPRVSTLPYKTILNRREAAPSRSE
jgi:hypothetical protein